MKYKEKVVKVTRLVTRTISEAMCPSGVRPSGESIKGSALSVLSCPVPSLKQSSGAIHARLVQYIGCVAVQVSRVHCPENWSPATIVTSG